MGVIMSRIRTVKAEFWTSEQIISCSPPARLLFIGLWNFCDDNGIHPASMIRLKAEVFPSDSCSNDEMKQWIAELIKNELLEEYEVERKSYWIVTGWKSHQRIDKPTYKYPLPLSKNEHSTTRIDTQNSKTTRRMLDDYSTSPRGVIGEYSQSALGVLDEPSATEWKGMDRIGKEKDICEVKTPPVPVAEKLSIADTPHKNSLSKEVQAIFLYWQQIMKHPQAKLDKKRQGKIGAALRLGFNVDQLKQAIDGCGNTPFNVGVNDRGQRYDSIDLIFRDADHIERFIAASRSYAPSNIANSSNPIFAGVL